MYEENSSVIRRVEILLWQLRTQKVSGSFEKRAPVPEGPPRVREEEHGWSFSQIVAGNRVYIGVQYFLGVVIVGNYRSLQFEEKACS